MVGHPQGTGSFQKTGEWAVINVPALESSPCWKGEVRVVGTFLFLLPSEWSWASKASPLRRTVSKSSTASTPRLPAV